MCSVKSSKRLEYEDIPDLEYRKDVKHLLYSAEYSGLRSCQTPPIFQKNMRNIVERPLRSIAPPMSRHGRIIAAERRCTLVSPLLGWAEGVRIVQVGQRRRRRACPPVASAGRVRPSVCVSRRRRTCRRRHHRGSSACSDHAQTMLLLLLLLLLSVFSSRCCAF